MRLINYVCGIAALVMLAPSPIRAQQAGGAVSASGRVSAVASVSAGSEAKVIKGDARVSVTAAGARGLVLSLSGRGGGETRIEIPLQLRSNADFALLASWTTRGATLSAFSVMGVSGAGAFVYPGVAGRVEVPAPFDGRTPARGRRCGRLEILSPTAILTGPPISMAGTKDSPNNMIVVVLRVVLTAPDYGKDWGAEMKLSPVPRAGTE